MDSRRPYELDNVYSQDQVQLVVREGEELELPAFEEVYNSDMVRECGGVCVGVCVGWVCVWVWELLEALHLYTCIYVGILVSIGSVVLLFLVLPWPQEDESGEEYFSDDEDGPKAKRKKTGDEVWVVCGWCVWCGWCVVGPFSGKYHGLGL